MRRLVTVAALTLMAAACGDGAGTSTRVATSPTTTQQTGTTTTPAAGTVAATTTASTLPPTTTTTIEPPGPLEAAMVQIFQEWDERDGAAIIRMASEVTGESVLRDGRSFVESLFVETASQYVFDGCEGGPTEQTCRFLPNANDLPVPYGFWMTGSTTLAEITGWGYEYLPGAWTGRLPSSSSAGWLVGSGSTGDTLLIVDRYDVEGGYALVSIRRSDPDDEGEVLDVIAIPRPRDNEWMTTDCQGNGIVSNQVVGIGPFAEPTGSNLLIRGALIVDLYSGEFSTAGAPENLVCRVEIP